MSSIESQFLQIESHHTRYPAIDPRLTLKGSAAGKVVLITGASQGIGQATAVAFAQAGARAIYLLARSEEALEKTQQLVRLGYPETGVRCQACDVTDDERVRAAIQDCVSRFGGLDIVDSNAGVSDPWVKIGESTPALWWNTWEVNLRGTYHVIRHSIPHLIASAREHGRKGLSGGHLILVSSVGAQLILPGSSAYGTSKHAINRLCEFVTTDHGDQGVKCFAVHPGAVKTELSTSAMPAQFHSSLVDELALPAGFAVWLSTGKADWATGRFLSANWDVDALSSLRERILDQDLLVNRLRAEKD